MRHRRAFTLVETVLVAGLGVVVLTLLIDIYMTGQRQSTKLETRLAAVQGAQLLIERIRQDVTASMFAPGDAKPLVESVLGGQLNRLNLLVFARYRYLERPAALYSPTDNDPSWVEGNRVTYTFEPTTHYVVRRYPGVEERLTFARFHSVRFIHLENAQPGAGATAENTVVVQLACVPEQNLRDAGPLPTGSVEVRAVIPLLCRSQYLSTDLWADTWFHLSPKVFESGR